MSEDDDRIAGIAASSRGGCPDWNNPDQVSAWQTAEGIKQWEASTASQSSPSSFTPYSNPSNESMTGPSSGYYSGSYSGRSSVRVDPLTGADVATFLGMVAGGYAGYSFASSNHGTSLELWLTTGGAALGAAFLCNLAAEVIKGSMSLSAAAGAVVLVVSGFVSGVIGYWYAENQHGSTAELWLAAALAACGAVFLLAFVGELFKGNITRFTIGSLLAMVAGGYAGQTYYDGTPLQDWLAAGIGALIVGFCAGLIEESLNRGADSQLEKRGLLPKRK